MPIEYNDGDGNGNIVAEPIRLKDKGQGVVGVIFKAEKQQASDWKSGEKLYWEDGNPIYEYVLNIAGEAGKAMFSVRDDEGKPVKGSDNRTQLEERTFNETDVCVIASGKGAYRLFKACKEARVNEGMKVRIERLTESGPTTVDYSVEVLDRDLPLKRFDPDAPVPSGIDYSDEPEPVTSPF